VTNSALREIIDGYAREPGVRGVENYIKRICRKSARRIVTGKARKVAVDNKDLPGLLGNRVFLNEDLFKNPRPGVVMGLAWTNMGGETLYIEATRVAADKPGFKQTGQLGSVMVESSEIAYTMVRSFFNKNGQAKESYSVIPGSTTGELRGLRGDGLSAVGHGTEHPFTLNYDLV